MICRLCLEESSDSFDIFSDNGETEVAKIIAKYFHVEVSLKHDYVFDSIKTSNQ